MSIKITPQAPPESGMSHRTQEETLVLDPRGSLRPSQMVERKLRGLLRGTPLPLSHMVSVVVGRGPMKP